MRAFFASDSPFARASMRFATGAQSTVVKQRSYSWMIDLRGASRSLDAVRIHSKSKSDHSRPRTTKPTRVDGVKAPQDAEIDGYSDAKSSNNTWLS